MYKCILVWHHFKLSRRHNSIKYSRVRAASGGWTVCKPPFRKPFLFSWRNRICSFVCILYTVYTVLWWRKERKFSKSWFTHFQPHDAVSSSRKFDGTFLWFKQVLAKALLLLQLFGRCRVQISVGIKVTVLRSGLLLSLHEASMRFF